MCSVVWSKRSSISARAWPCALPGPAKVYKVLFCHAQERCVWGTGCRLLRVAVWPGRAVHARDG
jgi:hypothetical protein